MELWLILLLTILPAIILMILIYRKDKERKEPKKLVLRAIIGGIIASVMAFFLEIFVSALIPTISDVWLSIIVEAFIIAGFIEEGCKYLGFRWLISKKPEFYEIVDGIVLLACVGLTFAAIENVLYGITGDLPTIIIRDLTAVPAHAMMTGIMGFFVGMAKVQKNKIYTILGFIIGMLLHGIYDFFAIASGSVDGLFFIGVIIEVILGYILFFKLIKLAIKLDKKYLSSKI